MMLNKTDFLEFIKMYEGNKRVDGFFTEYHFSKEAKKYFSPDQLSFNWYYTDFAVSEEAKAKAVKSNHLFFKLVPSGNFSRTNNADVVFIGALLKSSRNRVMLVVNQGDGSWKAKLVRGIGSDGSITFDNRYSEDANQLFKLIVDRIRNKDTEPKRIKPPSNKTSPNRFIELLYDFMEPDDRNEFILGRKFIYELFYKWFHSQPVDIDAVVCIDGEPVIIEYKRKCPAKWVLEGAVNDPEALLQLEDQYRSELTHINRPAFDDVRKLTKRDRFRPVERPSYGLDIRPHSLFMRWCFLSDIRYFHIIWNHEVNWSADSTRSSSQIDLKSWAFMKPQPLSSAYLIPSHCHGFSFTIGDDSGRDSGLRFQEMVQEGFLGEIKESLSMEYVFNSLQANFASP